MKLIKINAIILFLALMLPSCNIMKHETSKLPNKLLVYKSRLLFEIHNDSASNLGVCILPILTRRNHVGIYSFTRSGPHRVYNKVFMFNGKDISISDINSELIMISFLIDNNFSKHSHGKGHAKHHH